MHAYLIVGRDEVGVEKAIVKTARKLESKPLEFQLFKINDVRELSSFTKVLRSSPTAIVIKRIDKATNEALNAFLKNLEEPQERISYILTAENVRNILPTILSRCQIIKLKQTVSINSDIATKFLKMGTGKRLAKISEIKQRDEAIEYIESIIDSGHTLLHSNEVDFMKTSTLIESAESTLLALKANGNVGLQLTNFVVNTKH